MTTEPTTIPQQELEALAKAATVACDECKGGGYLTNSYGVPCGACRDKCQGTGRKYPGLSLDCPKLDEQYHCSNGEAEMCNGHHCDTCNCSGRVPVSPAEALYWLMGQEVFMALYRSIGRFSASWEPHERYYTKGSPLLAILAAMEASDV